MQKYFYPIFKLPTFYERDYVKEELPLWIKWWLLGKAGRELSEILTGSEFTLLHTLNRKFKVFELEGRTEQEQLTGKNLLDLSNLTSQTITGVTFTPYYENGLLKYINVNGTATANTVYNLATSYTIPAGSYVLNGCPSGGSWGTYSMAYGDKNDSGNGNSFALNDSYSAQAYIRIGNGTTVNNIKFYPMIRLSSVTDNTYEPYCGGIPSPNPQFPQPIKNVTGNANVKIQNKNLAVTNFTNNLSLSGSGNNRTVVTSSYKLSQIIKVKPNTIYTINGNYSSITDQRIRIYFFDEYPSIGKVSTKYIYSEPSTAYTFTTDVTTQYILLFGVVSPLADVVLPNLQLEQGSTATDYVPHQEQNYPFTFSEGQILGNEEELKDNGKDDIWGEYIFTGNENWIDYQGTQTGDFYKFYTTGVKLGRTNNMEARADAFCTHFINNNFYVNDNGIGLTQNATYISIDKTIASTPNELKTFFATQYNNGNPVKVQYKKKNPTVTAYTETQVSEYNAIKQAKTYKDVTYISSESSELPPLLDIQYWKERGAE